MIGKICGTGSYIPGKSLDNNDLAKFVDTNDEWIRERTRIIKRHVIEAEESTVSMSVKSAQAAVEKAGIDPQEIDLIIVATISSNVIMPCTACMVQAEIGAVHATAFDLNAACTGFVFAYNTAQAYIASGLYKMALVIGSESLSNLVDWQDRGTCILFGDGSGAVLLKAEEGTPYQAVTGSDGREGAVLTCESRHHKGWDPHGTDDMSLIKMDGQSVFKFAVRKVPESIIELMERNNLKLSDIDYFALHQANGRIIESVAKRLKLSMEQFPVNIEQYGNTSSASIPILLDEMNQKGMLKEGQKLVISGFGGGLTWGASIAVIQ